MVRWQHPSRGLLTADAFLLAAKECGLIGQLGAHMLATASHQAVAWGYPQVGRMMHVNTTARELSTDGFPATVSSILAAAGRPVRFLCLEITERQLVGEDPVVQRYLEALRGLGVALAIDDFGTEYASVSYLRRLPVDVLKIDRSFVTDVAVAARDAAIVVGIVAMARALGVRAVAEGVEPLEQARAAQGRRRRGAGVAVRSTLRRCGLGLLHCCALFPGGRRRRLAAVMKRRALDPS